MPRESSDPSGSLAKAEGAGQVDFGHKCQVRRQGALKFKSPKK